MKWLFIIDPLENLNPDTDTTYALIKESSRRDIRCFIACVNDLFFDKSVKINATEIIFGPDSHSLRKNIIHILDDFEIIFMRKEPPYDIKFHYATILLSFCNTLIVNSPKALRDFNEKLIILNFPMLIPKTLVTSDTGRVIKFVGKNGQAVLKSLDSYQGKFIYRINKGDKNIKSKILAVTKNGAIPVMIQKFLPDVYHGDKRILLLNGKSIGAVNRVPKKGSYVSNFGQGGRGEKTEITQHDKKIINNVSGFLLNNGIQFAGLDVIDGHLTEINITCPTGVMQINAIEKRKLEKVIVNYFEKLVRKKL